MQASIRLDMHPRLTRGLTPGVHPSYEVEGDDVWSEPSLTVGPLTRLEVAAMRCAGRRCVVRALPHGRATDTARADWYKVCRGDDACSEPSLTRATDMAQGGGDKVWRASGVRDSV